MRTGRRSHSGSHLAPAQTMNFIIEGGGTFASSLAIYLVIDAYRRVIVCQAK